MKEIACLTGVELLMDYLEGVLPTDVHAALEAHVAGCARCAAFVASYLRDATDSAGSDRRHASRPRRGFAQKFRSTPSSAALERLSHATGSHPILSETDTGLAGHSPSS